MVFRKLFIIFVFLPLTAESRSFDNDSARNEDYAIAFQPANKLISTRSNSDNYDLPVLQYVPKSPTVSSLAKAVDIPVSFYTGIPDVSIPLYEIEIDNVSIPLVLSYHASGIRADQEASWVGLGWNLTVGGIITRTVKGGDDFQEYPNPNNYTEGYLTSPEATYPYSETYWQTTVHPNIMGYVVRVQKKDSEPDIFSYSIPGASGKFLIDKSRGAVLMDKSNNIKIDLLTQNNKKYFQITSTDGTRYLFNCREKTSSYSRSGFLNMNLNSATKYDESESYVNSYYNSPFIYTSSWFLTEIITPRQRHVYFEYASESYQSPAMESLAKFNTLHTSGGSLNSRGLEYSVSKSYAETYRLSQISWDGGKIIFSTTSRNDVRGLSALSAPQKLSSVSVYDKSNILVKSYNLTYSYFNNDYSGSYPQVFKRLMLESVTNQADSNERYLFSYYDGTMPAKNTKNTDYWGFPNGVNQGPEYQCQTKYNGQLYPGADKDPRLNKAIIGMLHTIDHPTGSTSVFNYELNKCSVTTALSQTTETITKSFSVYKYEQDDFYAYLPEYKTETITLTKQTCMTIRGEAEIMTCLVDNNVIYGSGGTPVFKLSRIGSNNNITEIFSYTIADELRYNCSYSYPTRNLTLSSGTYKIEAMAPVKDGWFSFACTYEQEIPTNPNNEINAGGLRISSIQGETNRVFSYQGGRLLVEPILSRHAIEYFDVSGSLGYSDYMVQLSESTIPLGTLENGYIVGYDMVTESYGNGDKVVYRYKNSPETHNNECEMAPNELNCYNGLLWETSYYKGSTLYKQISNTYCDEPEEYTVNAFIFDFEEQYTYPYTYCIRWPILEKTVAYQTGENSGFNIITNYTYNNLYQPMTESVTVDGDTYTRQFFYSSDYNSGIYAAMNNSHMIGIPMETILMKNGIVIKGQKTDYQQLNSGLIVPHNQYVLHNAAPISFNDRQSYYGLERSFDEYDAYGNPLQITEKGDNTVYLWSYNGIYPVAIIKGVGLSQVQQHLSSSFITQLASKISPSSSDMAILNSLRTLMPATQIETFVYQPLVGLMQKTDERGLISGFDYDTSGRLSETYYMNGGIKNTIQKYNYHYINK